MAARKKSKKNTPRKTLTDRSPAREFTVVVEDLRSQFQVFGEALAGLTGQMAAGFAEVRQGFAQVDARFAQVDARFAQVDARFAQVDARFDQIDARFDGVDREIGLLKSAVLQHGRELRERVTRDEAEEIAERALARRG